MPEIPLGSWIESLVQFLLDHLDFVFNAISVGIGSLIGALESLLKFLPYPIIIFIFAILGWRLVRRNVGILVAFGFLLIVNLGLWEETMETLTLVIVATVIVVVAGLPLGIWAARNRKVQVVTNPLLDLMQSMPAFVYLIPALMFFGLGRVPGVMATVIFAMPPVIRLTTLGIQQVPAELIEAADAFGSTPRQKLYKVELPMALPTIMAGINQAIMLSLSMVVISAMIGAKGLGAEVLRSISRLDIGLGFESGLAVVILAMSLDRITQALGQRHQSS